MRPILQCEEFPMTKRPNFVTLNNDFSQVLNVCYKKNSARWKKNNLKAYSHSVQKIFS